LLTMMSRIQTINFGSQRLQEITILARFLQPSAACPDNDKFCRTIPSDERNDKPDSCHLALSVYEKSPCWHDFFSPQRLAPSLRNNCTLYVSWHDRELIILLGGKKRERPTLARSPCDDFWAIGDVRHSVAVKR
jgi:hypothetical protein